MNWPQLQILVFALTLPCAAQLPTATQESIDGVAKKVLANDGVASASIAVVKEGRIAYVQAYGYARLEPRTPATPAMRYKVGSNTKQFTATAVLLLCEQGKLRLDDPVEKYLPGLTRGAEITIRQLLSHTSGYEDYYPLDYVAPFMAAKTTPGAIIDTWARKPLNFEPGTKWEYSNTNYTIAGEIVEKAAGKPLFEFLGKTVFEPLKMKSVVNIDGDPWDSKDPVGYTRFALGPARPVVREGAGWAGAAGQLAMTPEDLARWDISLMNGSILKPESMKALTTSILLKNGSDSGYGLGLGIGNRNGHRRWSHSGGVAGFISQNETLPDDRVSVTVLTNQESNAAGTIMREIEAILIAPPVDPDATRSLDLVRRVFSELQEGRLDRGVFTSDGNAYFTTQVVADFAASLKPLGAPTNFVQTAAQDRGGMRSRNYAIRTASQNLTLSTYFSPSGKLSQYLIYPAGPAQHN